MATATAATPGSLSVIALVSGGKDSFYSILHCQANGHRVVALANLYPSGSTEEHEAQPQEAIAGAEQQQPGLPSGSPSPSSQRAHYNEAPVPWQRDSTTLLELEADDARAGDCERETDLNSFMYQTVGHQIIPLYARATGIPLHRQPIVGTAVHHGLSYENPRRRPQRLAAPSSSARRPSDGALAPATGDLQGYGKRQDDDVKGHEPELEPESDLEDETESLVPLLRTVLKAHPEVNALCTGAILSTYQRTRVESVALRLGLVPLSYLWQYTELLTSVDGGHDDQCVGLAEKLARNSHDPRRRGRGKGAGPARDDARLLRDMAVVGLEARIVKVASAGLDEGFLWENVASEAGVQRMARAMRRFGAAGGRGSILGEGGEFETLVVDGPPSLFKGRIVVADENKRVIREGGGCAWLSVRRADVVLKDELEQAGESGTHALNLRIPDLLDPRFEDAMRCLLVLATGDKQNPGFLDLALCNDIAKPAVDLGSTSRSYSIVETDLPKRQLPLSPQSSPSQEWGFSGHDGAGSRNIEAQTVSIVDRICQRLDRHALPATAITNTVILLRHMSDFPLINEHYGSLFPEPNPPSRVTVSCGDELLPKGADIAVYLTVQLCLQPQERRGLHVQSRSYWAPANIGPYSQAIAFPLLLLPVAKCPTREDDKCRYEPQQTEHASCSPLAVSIAGQIPLLPASMTLPPSSGPDHVELQITLALQHLWRIGIEMRVRWWTSAVAYFPATLSAETMRHQALLAAAAWVAAHLWPDLDGSGKDNGGCDVSDDDDDPGPDLWDRRYNAEFVTYGGGDEEESFPLSLPNWSVLKGFDVNDDDNTHANVLLRNRVGKTPFFFAAEVEELPRQAGVEWHAHLGLAELPPGSVTLCSTACGVISSPGIGLFDLKLEHVVVDSGDAVFVQTTAALQLSTGYDASQRTPISVDTLRSVLIATSTSLRKLLSLLSQPSIEPKITYTDGLRLVNGDDIGGLGALVPCRSLWDARGRQLSAVCVFEMRAARTN
ncbi:hypothetical protein F4802DRAFT_153459 [Xylaria palmicola]|nr:hypothetical protein F4802DRAFT_153459 [Xylaria palmicola]